MALKWYCDSCGEEVEHEEKNFRVAVSTAEGPVTVLLSSGYGRSDSPGFNPQSSGAVICKRCVYLAMQSEFAMEDTNKAHRGTGLPSAPSGPEPECN